MFKWFSTLIFTNFILDCNSGEYLLNATTDEALAEHHLDVVNYKEFLPLVLFLVNTEEGPNLDAPEDIYKAELRNRKMRKGTLFTYPTSKIQLFFCRDPRNPDEECLAPQNFTAPEQLRCGEYVESTAKVMQDKPAYLRCGVSNAGFSYSVYYPICASNEYIYKARSFALYGFCYLHEFEKTLYTRHFILSPKLLKSKLFRREHQADIPYELPIPGFIPAIYGLVINARDSDSRSSIRPLRPNYEVQRLVPREDMALGIWQKTTYQAFNFDLQQKALKPIWEEICLKVRQFAIEHDDIKLDITTAVINTKVFVPSEHDIQIYNRWVKLVLARSQNLEVLGGVIFFMNNFLLVRSEFQYGDYVFKNLKEEMQEYCEVNICTHEFQERTQNGGVKCCKVTPKIAELLGDNVNGNAEVLVIPGLTQLPYT